MHDILPEDQPLWQYLGDVCSEISNFYGFGRIETPILEYAELFVKGTGIGSEIVQKQMYTLKTQGGDFFTLRPEGTPPVVRAYIEHGMSNLPSPVRLYYMGPMFRHERPQAGRFRQFYQFGLEIIGEEDPVLDAQVIQLFSAIFKTVRLSEIIIHVNSIGCAQCHPRYKKVLKDYYRNRVRQVCADCRQRYKLNPLRMLDCKDEKCQRAKAHVPAILDYLCEGCHNHFKAVLEYLEVIGFPYFVDQYLVRGLDYYTKTVFEIFAGNVQPSEATSQRIALVSGGRYDGLVKLLGGRDTPAVGAAMGMERVINLLREKNIAPPKHAPEPRVFLIQLGNLAKKHSLKLLEQFRVAGIGLQESLGRDSIKSQLRLADKAGAEYALILGQKEVLDDTIIVREMEGGIQETIPFETIIPYIKKQLAKQKKKKK